MFNWSIVLECMAGGWYLIFGSFAARFCEKNITLPPCYFASSSMQITLGHHQQKVPHPPNKIDQQNNFLYVSPLFTSKKHPKKVAFLVNLPLWLSLRKKKNHHEAQGPGSGSNGAPDVVPLGTWTFVHLHHHHQSRRSVTSKGHGPSLTRWRWEFFGVWKTFPIGSFSDQANKKAFFGIESWHKS